MRQKAKPKHAAIPEHIKRRHGDGWPQTPPRLHQRATRWLRAAGLSGLPVDARQLCYERSPLPVCNDSASAVEQMLPYSVTGTIWRCWLLFCSAWSCRALGLKMPCVVIQPSGLGWASFVDSEAQQMSQTLGAHKSNASLWLSGGVFLSWICRACGSLSSWSPWHVRTGCYAAPTCSVQLCPNVVFCRVTQKYHVCFRHLLPSFFNGEATNFLIQYRVLLNIVTTASDKTVANHLYPSCNHLHECGKQIFRTEVLTPIYCCDLKSDAWFFVLFIQKVFPNPNSFTAELLFKLWAL